MKQKQKHRNRETQYSCETAGTGTMNRDTRTALERGTDDLERRLKEKIEQNTNFAGPEGNARKLEHEFKFFDTNSSGAIDYQEFFAAMTHFNFVGVQQEMEALFNRYDEDASGDLDYHEFAYHLFGIGGAPKMDVNSKNVVGMQGRSFGLIMCVII
jgi:hypothetical protein